MNFSAFFLLIFFHFMLEKWNASCKKVILKKKQDIRVWFVLRRLFMLPPFFLFCVFFFEDVLLPLFSFDKVACSDNFSVR